MVILHSNNALLLLAWMVEMSSAMGSGVCDWISQILGWMVLSNDQKVNPWKTQCGRALCLGHKTSLRRIQFLMVDVIHKMKVRV